MSQKDDEGNRKRKERTLLGKEISKERWKERKRDRRKSSSERWRRETQRPRRWGGRGEIEVLEAGSLRRLGASPGPGFSGFPHRRGAPRKPLWAPFVCSRPGSGDAVDLVFKQRACSLLGRAGVC